MSFVNRPQATDEDEWADVADTVPVDDYEPSDADDPRAPVDEWTTTPFDDAGNLPAFPVHILPPALRDFVEAEAEATQTPPELAACIVIAVLSAALQKKFEVEVRPGWREPLSTFWAVAMAPGERKSAVFRDATAPIREWERSQAVRLQATIAAATTKRAIKERKHTEQVRIAAVKRDGLAAAYAEELAAELAEERLPIVPRVACDDTTPEKLISLIADHGGRMAVLSAEGGIFDTIAGRYSDGVANLDGLLKGHAGDELRVDRMSRPALHVRRPAVTLGLCVQPDVLQGLAGKPSFRGRGLLARFLFVLPQSHVGHRNVAPASVPPAVTAAYNAMVLGLLALPETRADDGEIEPEILRLSASDRAAVEALALELEPRLARGADLESVRDWASKSIGAVVRISALLQLASHSVYRADHSARFCVTDDRDEIEPNSAETDHSVHCAYSARPADEMDTATSVREKKEIHSFLIDHVLGAFRVIGADPSMSRARTIWDWAVKNKLRSFTQRQAHTALRGTFKRSRELDEPLAVLIEHGFVREAKPPERQGSGRKPSPSFETHPSAHNTHNTHNR